MHEVAFHRRSLWIEHQRHRAALQVFVSILSANQVPPPRPAEDVFGERERVFEIVLLHNPRSPQATPRKIVLNEILLQHYLFENLRERIAAGIRAVPLLLRHRNRVRIKEMPESRISADQDDLLERIAEPALLQQPEKAFDRDIDHVICGFLAGRAMDHMSNPAHRSPHRFPVRDISGYDLQPFTRLRAAVVAQRAYRNVRAVVEHTPDEMTTYFACCTGHKDSLHDTLHLPAILSGRCRPPQSSAYGRS